MIENDDIIVFWEEVAFAESYAVYPMKIPISKYQRNIYVCNNH